MRGIWSDINSNNCNWGFILTNIDWCRFGTTIPKKGGEKMLTTIVIVVAIYFIGMLVKPLIAGAIMGLATGAVYYGGMHLMANDGRLYKLIWMIIAMAVAGVTYGTGVIVTKAVTVDELSRMPIIKKFIK